MLTKMITPFLHWKDYRTSYRLLAYILFISSIFTIISTGIQLFFDYHRDVQKIYEGINHIKEGYLDSIAGNLWALEEDQIRRNLEGAFNLPDIQYLEVRELSSSSDSVVESIGQKIDGNIISETFVLEHGKDHRRIGTLLVIASKDAVIGRLKEKVLIILATQAIKTFFVSIAMLMIFYFLVMRHLNTIKGYFDRFDLDRLSVPLSINRRTEPDHPDEFSRLVNSINYIRKRLNASLIEIDNSMAAVQESEARWRSLTEKSPDHILSLDKNLNIDFANFASPGLTVEQLIGTPLYHYVEGKEKQAEVRAILHNVLESGEPQTYETVYAAPDGINIFYESRVAPKKRGSSDNIIGLTVDSRDITLRKQVESKLQSSLKEKETLLHEIHHRVKNNMQIIASLLDMQLSRKDEQTVESIVKESKGRIYAMAAIHESFHQSENLSEIDLNRYVQQLSRLLSQTYVANPEGVHFDIEIPELRLTIDKANPLGLVLNELISNSLKYAFPDGKNGTISIKVVILDKDNVQLCVSDDGAGLPDDFDWDNTNTLGLRLVTDLVERQLNGSVIYENQNGTLFTIKFNLDSDYKS